MLLALKVSPITRYYWKTWSAPSGSSDVLFNPMVLAQGMVITQAQAVATSAKACLTDGFETVWVHLADRVWNEHREAIESVLRLSDMDTARQLVTGLMLEIVETEL